MSIDFSPLGWVFFLALLGLILIRLHRRGKPAVYLLAFAAFGVYLCLVMKATLFPITIDPEMAEIFRSQGVTIWTQMNLKPLFFGQFATPRSILYSAGLNVLLTVPFGFGIGFLARLKPIQFLGLAAVVGAGIDGTQLLISLALGYPYRVFDINDVIMNALGVLLGYVIFWAAGLCFSILARYIRLPRTALWNYLRGVFGVSAY